MKRFQNLILASVFVLGFAIALLPAGNASAINVFPKCGAAGGSGSTEVCKAANTDEASSMTKVIINTMLFILGILSVIMIIVSGLRYVASAGDASRVKSAKDTLVYSIVGLVIALLSFAIVNYVLDQF